MPTWLHCTHPKWMAAVAREADRIVMDPRYASTPPGTMLRFLASMVQFRWRAMPSRARKKRPPPGEVPSVRSPQLELKTPRRAPGHYRQSEKSSGKA